MPLPQAKAAKTWTCLRCDKQFTAGSWRCEDGQPHQVELKTYYVATEGLTVFYGAVTGTEVINKQRGVISFNRGAFQSTDPEQQEFLDNYGGCVSYDKWRETHIDDKERLAQDKRQRERLEQSNNELLKQVREMQEENARLKAQAQQKPVLDEEPETVGPAPRRR